MDGDSFLILLLIKYEKKLKHYHQLIEFLYVISCGNFQTSHVMLTGKGANQFAESIGINTVPTDKLVTEYEKKEWEKHKKYIAGVMQEFNTKWYAVL